MLETQQGPLHANATKCCSAHEQVPAAPGRQFNPSPASREENQSESQTKANRAQLEGKARTTSRSSNSNSNFRFERAGCCEHGIRCEGRQTRIQVAGPGNRASAQVVE